ncbi:MAG TPA: MoaD/ThiS family protein [Burkholderiales bacterium]|nr:MoaD/ThiS family protein [Burkholderiales bacterium]
MHLVLVNGFYVYPTERTTRNLKDGDVLAIWPPIAGG